MSKEIVYLEDGQECLLVSKTDDYYIVRPFYLDGGYNYSEDYTDVSGESVTLGEEILVKLIFDKPPVIKYNTEITKLLLDKDTLLMNINKLKNEERDLKRKVEASGKKLVDKNNFIINKTELVEAKTIAIFYRNFITPKLYKRNRDVKDSSLMLNFKVNLSKPKNEGCNYTYQIYDDGDTSSNTQICDMDGYVVDYDPKEIIATIKKRIKLYPNNIHSLYDLDDELLDDELKLIKQEQIKNKKLSLMKRNVQYIEDYKKDILRCQKEIEEYEKEIGKTL